MFIQIDHKFKQVELENNIRNFWEGCDIFAKLIKQTSNGKPWMMIDGPVTANNRLGVHHGWGRTYKDIFQRFNAMQGRNCLWQNGFDCQGLWVEVEVEKELNISGPRDIKAVGIEKFATSCRNRVTHYIEEIIEQSKSLGQWADWGNSYRTDSNNNISHIWHFLKKCHEKKLIYSGIKVMPWCARCGTSLSNHEMAESYQDRTDTAINFLCTLSHNQKEAFMVWTTTPWTIPANTALAVHPDLTYVQVNEAGRLLWVSESYKNKMMADSTVVARKSGKELLGLRYFPPYKLQEVRYQIVPWNGVDPNTGTGIVHIAPAFGADDLDLFRELGREKLGDPYYGFHNFVPVDEYGIYNHADLPMFKNQHWQKANTTVIKDLSDRNLLIKKETITHRCPHCWRCKEPVIYRQSSEWFIAVTKIREQLLTAANEIKWSTDHCGLHMKNWLENMGDWCISRRRFWGLPLPFYQCLNCYNLTVFGSFEELSEKTIDPFDFRNSKEDYAHRPHIDNHVINCGHCKKPVKRIEEVGDCWLDAGIVPFSTFDYNSNGRHPEYPFDFACEMREQVRLWFYSALVMGVVLEGEAPFKRIATYDEMKDEKGQRFSKTKGNAPSLDKIIGVYGADVLRFALAEAPVDQAFQFSETALKKAKKTFNTLWNCAAYFAQYANADQPNVIGILEISNPLDYWVVNRMSQFVDSTAKSLENYDARSAVFLFSDFVNDLSTWYIRLKRPVFAGPNCDEKENSYRILYASLKTISLTMAPLFPFTAEELYCKIVRPCEPNLKESVHLNPFPSPQMQVVDETILSKMICVQDVVQIALSIRNGAKFKVKQPLRKAIIENWADAEQWQRDIISQEVNVLEVTTNESIPYGSFKVSCHDMYVYVSLDLDEELKELGAVRELIRFIQDKRKDFGLVVGDKIAILSATNDNIWDVIQKHLNDIIKKTNTTAIERVESFNDGEKFFDTNLEALNGNIRLLISKK